MMRSRGLAVTCALLVWMLGAPLALSQGKTNVRIAPIGNQELRVAAGNNASAVITALNQAAYFDERPDLSGLPVSPRAREDILSRWEDSQFYCNQTRLDRSLVQREKEMYEIRNIPLIVEGEEQRNGILAVNAEGKVIGFRYSDEPVTGTLIVASEPSGATVVSPVGDTLTQTTPAQFENVPKGQHEFTIRKEAYEEIDTTFVVQAYQSVRHTVRLTPTFGYLRIEADVETVRVDGTERSPSKGGRIQIDTGEHLVELSGKYYQPYETTLTVGPGQTEVLSPELRRKSVPLRVSSSPTGATVIMDGEAVGTTPLDATLEAGRTYTLWVEEEGHVPSTRMDVIAEPDSVIEREITLSPVYVETEGGNVQIKNVRVKRSKRQVDITYDLRGNPDETYEMRLSITDRDGDPIESNPDAAQGAIGEGIAPGPDKKIRWRGALPDGATVRLVQGVPSFSYAVRAGGSVAYNVEQDVEPQFQDAYTFSFMAGIPSVSLYTKLNYTRRIEESNFSNQEAFDLDLLAKRGLFYLGGGLGISGSGLFQGDNNYHPSAVGGIMASFGFVHPYLEYRFPFAQGKREQMLSFGMLFGL